MARYNEILVGRFNRLAQKLLSMKGPPVMATLHDELHLQVPLFHGNENRYLESWNLFGFAGNPGGNPTNTVTQLRLRNPTGSNVIAVIYKAMASVSETAGDAVTLSHRAINTDLANAVVMTNTRFDPRGSPTPSLVGSSANPGANAPLDIIDRKNMLNNTSVDFIITRDQEIPLLPGDSIQMETGNAIALGSITILGFWWRERFLEDSERS